MRTLTGNLETNQKSLERYPLCKLVLTKAGESTQTYNIDSSTNRLLALTHIEQEFSQIANVAVNSDATLAALSLHGYTATISYGYNDGTNGDEYSAAAPLEVVAMKSDTMLNRSQAMLVTWFTCAGIFDMMEADKASAKYTQDSGNTDTVKTLLTAVANATLSPFSHCKNYTITFDSEDSLIDSYIPADFFYVAFNESRLTAFQKLIKTTKCKARIEADGNIHIFYPKITGSDWAASTAYVRGDYVQPTTATGLTYECTTAGTSDASEPTWPTTAGGTVVDNTVTWTARDYDYEYNDAASNHNFFEKSTRQRLVIPTKWIVEEYSDYGSGYSGSAADSASETALGRSLPSHKYVRAASNAECTAIATALLQHDQVAAEKGHGEVPMNCGQEVMDYINITDSIASDSRAGNVGYLKRQYRAGQQFSMEIRFGRPAQQLPWLGGEAEARPFPQDFYALRDYVDETNKMLAMRILSLFFEAPHAPVGGPWQFDEARLPVTIDIDFSATDNDDVSWGAGTITFADRSTLSINSGSLNLANANEYYLYAVLGNSTLQNTQTFGDAIGGEKFLIAFLKKAPATNQKALIVPAQGGKSPTFNQDVIGANTITASEIYVGSLSAISADMGLLTAGEIRVGKGTFGTDFTGWRLWVESSVGRMAGYKADTLQWYSDTDGKLNAGGGAVILDANGISIDDENLNMYSGGLVTKVLSLGYYDTSSIVRLKTWNSADLGIYSAGRAILQAGTLNDSTNDLDLYGGKDVNITPGGVTRIKFLQVSDPTLIGSALDQEYQNTNDFPILVIASIRLDSGEGVTAAIGSFSPPGTDAAVAVSSGARTDIPITFIVPDGWYYKIATDAGSPSVAAWNEFGIGD